MSFLWLCKKKRAEFYHVGCKVFFISYMVFLKGPSCLISKKNVSATPITRNPLNNLNHSPATLFHTFLTFLLFFHGNFISKFHNAIVCQWIATMLSSWFWNILKCNISLLQLTGDVWRIYMMFTCRHITGSPYMAVLARASQKYIGSIIVLKSELSKRRPIRLLRFHRWF